MSLPLKNEERSSPASYDEEPSQGLGRATTPQGDLPLRSVDIVAQVIALDVEIAVEQVFANPHAAPVEVTWIFPLPPRAAVDRFEAELGGRRIEGMLKERGQARADYTQAVSSGQRAALVEEERPDVFTVTIGNLMPGEEARLLLTMVGPLQCRDGEVTLRIPLVVAPRYIPGTPQVTRQVGRGRSLDTAAVPDASRITPPQRQLNDSERPQLSVAVEIDPAGLRISRFSSSLHGAEMARFGELFRVRYAPDERMDRDLILRFCVDEDAVQARMVVVPQPEGGAAFAITAVPPRLPTLPRPRDLVFVIDRSGSMSGWKMVAARRAVRRMIAALRPQDRFCVLAFDGHVESPDKQDGLVPATERACFFADLFLSQLESRGGTEMAGPLRRAADLLRDGSRDRQLVLVTDGQVGNEDQILAHLGRSLRGVRVCTVGIDRAVNEGFLRRLATPGGFELVESEDRLNTVMTRLERMLGTPVLTGLRVEADGIEVDTLLPQQADLFAGVPVVLRGRLLDGAPVTARVVGTDPRGRQWSQGLPIHQTDQPSVALMWAREQVRALEDRYATERSAALRHKLIETSLHHGVLCRFTAFVAIDEERVTRGQAPVSVAQPVESPEGWASPGAPLPFPTFGPGDFELRSSAPMACAMPDRQASMPMVMPEPMASAPMKYSAPRRTPRKALGGSPGGAVRDGIADARHSSRPTKARDLYEESHRATHRGGSLRMLLLFALGFIATLALIWLLLALAG